MKRISETYTNEDVIENAKRVKSMAALIKSLNLKICGGSYVKLNKLIRELNIDTSHWTGKLWNKHRHFKQWNEYSKINSLKQILLEERGYVCECCGLSEWMGKQIKLEIHHINGDKKCNTRENLQLLCPNCHSFTDTWRCNKK